MTRLVAGVVRWFVPPREQPDHWADTRRKLGRRESAMPAGLVVIGDWRLEERVDEFLGHAERRQAKELRDADRAKTEEQIGGMVSGQRS